MKKMLVIASFQLKDTGKTSTTAQCHIVCLNGEESTESLVKVNEIGKIAKICAFFKHK